jgi:hypothetical protein
MAARIKTLNDEMRKAWEDLEPAKRRLRRSTFYVTTSTTTDLCYVVPDSVGDDIERAGLYGAIVGTFAPLARQQPRESEPRLDPIPQQPVDPLVQQMCDEVFAAAPAFMCSGRLAGAAAEFADYFAIAMLRERNSSLG